jgi:hypothetical protein
MPEPICRRGIAEWHSQRLHLSTLFPRLSLWMEYGVQRWTVHLLWNQSRKSNIR